MKQTKRPFRGARLFRRLLAASAVLLLTGCGGAGDPASSGSAPPEISEDPPVAGGWTDSTNPNAPKVILSTELSSFSCEIWLYGYPEDWPWVTIPSCILTARRDGDTVLCERNDETFTAEPAFLEELQEIVARYDLAQYNGIDRETHGLPENFGVTLRADYASGETIFASDNTLSFLPADAVRALTKLFGLEPSYTSITPEEAIDLMNGEENAVILDVRREEEYDSGHIPGAICLPNEEIQEGAAKELFAPDRLLLVYCRTGVRSRQAAQALIESGYTRVYEFGGIFYWPGDIVTD